MELIRHKFMHMNSPQFWGLALEKYNLRILLVDMDKIECIGTRWDVNGFMAEHFPSGEPYGPTEPGNAD